jgi:hypothetical protein
VDQKLLLRNEYLAAENRILKAKLQGRLRLTDAERVMLGEIGHRLGRKALGEVATAALPGTIRRKIIHFAVTENPTQVWLSHQMTDAFLWDTAPRYLLRDRDASYGPIFRTRIKGMGIEETVIAPRSPWQNPYAERIIASIRRECLDQVIVFNERHLRRLLSSYFQ